MPRDLSGMGRYPPQPRYQPFAFYTAVRVGDPEMLARIMQASARHARLLLPRARTHAHHRGRRRPRARRSWRGIEPRHSSWFPRLMASSKRLLA
jgi:hypothetical protein